MPRIAAILALAAACATGPKPEADRAIADLSPETAPATSGLLTPGTDPVGEAPAREDPRAEDPACPSLPDRPALASLLDARAAFAAHFHVDPNEVQPGWFTVQATPWLPRVAGVVLGRISGRVGDGTPSSVGVLVFDWCPDRPEQVCFGASLRLDGRDRGSLAALVDLRGAPRTIPLQPRAPVFTRPDDGCTRMPALVVRATGRDGDTDHETVVLLSLSGDGRELHRTTAHHYPDGGTTLEGLALVDGPPDQPLDLDVTLQGHLRRGSRCLRPDPETTRHRLGAAGYTVLTDAQLRPGCH